MAKYRKKAVEVEAWGTKSGERAPDWLQQAEVEGRASYHFAIGGSGFSMSIKTLEGVMTADFGDFIIRGVKGEIYPCKPDIFEATYDKVDE